MSAKPSGRKIAVVGSGIAGLACAWLLSRRYSVTIYELHPSLGMDAHAVNVDQSGRSTRVDLPMRVFFSSYYPHLTRLYEHLGIGTEELDYSASFSSVDGRFYFQYTNVELGGQRLPFLTRHGLASASAWRIGIDTLRFFLRLPRDIAAGRLRGITIDQYLRSRGLSAEFAERMLFPAYAGICTCSYENVRQYPAETILSYLGSGLLFSGMRRVRMGAKNVVERLAAGIDDVRCGTPVTDVRRNQDGVTLIDGRGNCDQYDHVVFATQANQTRRILQDKSPGEAAMLASFRYEPSTVLLHTDPRLAPKKRAWWSPVNFLLREGSQAPMATIPMNDVHRDLGNEPMVFQTWNPLLDPEPGKLLAESSFERPVVDFESLRGIERLTQLHNERERNVWFCGSYAATGIPLLESAVDSAFELGQRLGCVLPWETRTRPHERPTEQSSS